MNQFRFDSSLLDLPSNLDYDDFSVVPYNAENDEHNVNLKSPDGMPSNLSIRFEKSRVYQAKPIKDNTSEKLDDKVLCYTPSDGLPDNLAITIDSLIPYTAPSVDDEHTVQETPNTDVVSRAAPHKKPSLPKIDLEDLDAIGMKYMETGDPTLAGLIYQQMNDRLVGFATKYLKDRERAEDIVGDKFSQVVLANQLSGFKGDSKLSTYLMTAVKNACIDHLRRKATQTTDYVDFSDRPDLATTSPKAEKAIDAHRMESLLTEAIDSLTSSDHREILNLQLEGLSYKQISDTLDVPEGTVMSRLYYARKRIARDYPELAAFLGKDVSLERRIKTSIPQKPEQKYEPKEEEPTDILDVDRGTNIEEGIVAAAPIKVDPPVSKPLVTRSFSTGKPAGHDLQMGQEGDDLIIKYTGLVERIAGRLAKRLPPSIQLDELIGIGYEALITSARSGTVQRGGSELQYLRTRINGAMIDELRKRDIVPRSVRNAKRDIEYAQNGLTELLGRKPTREEIREELGWTEERFELYLNSNLSALISIDAPVGDDSGITVGDSLAYQDDASAEETIAREASKVFARQLLERLPERTKRIVHMHYIQGLRMVDIAQMEGVTESRISQICKWARQHLRQGSDVEDYR